VKENCVVGSEDEGLCNGLQVFKLRKGILISLERFIENLEILNFAVLKQFFKSFEMLLQLGVIQRHSSIVSMDRFGRLETCRVFRNIIEISDEVQEWLHLFAGSAIKICIETN